LFADLAKSCNIKVPLTSKIDAFKSSDVLPYKLLIKPKLGQAGEKQVKCNNISQYKSFIESNKDNLDDYFVQEYIEGPISNLYSINIIMDENFNPICSFSINRLNIFRSKKIREGISTFIRSIPLEKLIRECIIFLKKIKYVGFGELEFKKDDNGEFNLIEINTRLWAWLKLATISGIDFPYYYIKYLLKKDDVELDDNYLNNFKEGLYYLRWAPDFYTNIFRFINRECSLADFLKMIYQRLLLFIKGKLIIEKFESFRWVYLIIRQRNRWV
jgi:predicted ATP-grasp superfamily ATP-dependent carboligase